MARKVNAATLAHIKSFEGLRLKAYPDPGSSNGEPWTIGYGSTRGVKKGMVITEAEAEARLVQDLETAERSVGLLVKVPLNDNQFGALVSFVFNIGTGAFKDSTLLRLLNAGDYDAVPAQLRRWDKNDSKVMPGLTRRRASEAEIWDRPAPLPIDLPDEPETPTSDPAKSSGIGWLAFALFAVAAAGAVAIFTPLF